MECYNCKRYHSDIFEPRKGGSDDMRPMNYEEDDFDDDNDECEDPADDMYWDGKD